jgi:hypothetical protein
MKHETRDTDVLIVVDVQNDFCPGGSLSVPHGDEVVPTVNELGQRFRHVVLTQDWHPPEHRSFASTHPGRQAFQSIELAYGPQVQWPDHCVQGTAGAEFHAGLQIPRTELILRKGYRRDTDSRINPWPAWALTISASPELGHGRTRDAAAICLFAQTLEDTLRLEIAAYLAAELERCPCCAQPRSNQKNRWYV